MLYPLEMPADAPPFEPGRVYEFSTELATPSPYYLGHQVEVSLCDRLAEERFDKLIFITDRRIFEPHGRRLYARLSDRFECELYFVEIGEVSKRFTLLETLCEALVALGASKSSLCVAFGGGSVGNIVGLAAGLLYRGVRFVEIPTTMTGQTDSTLSNKQAVNGTVGKNLFGLYHAPVWVWADTAYLSTESLISKKSGVVEGIKNGLVLAPTLLDYFDSILSPGLPLSVEEEWELVYKILHSKLEIIRRDPSEKGYGMVLEYGHTFGHAIEWLSKGALQHGEAVAVGMRMAADVSMAMGLLSSEEVALHDRLLGERLDLNPELVDAINVDSLIQTMAFDNKRDGHKGRFVLLEGLGRCFNPRGNYLVPVDESLLADVLTRFLKNWPDRGVDTDARIAQRY